MKHLFTVTLLFFVIFLAGPSDAFSQQARGDSSLKIPENSRNNNGSRKETKSILRHSRTQAVQSFGKDFVWYRYLGVANFATPIKKSPSFSIPYYDRGFDKYKPKKTEVKTPKFLEKKGAGHLVPEFQTYEVALTASPDYIGVIIDDAYRKTKKRFIDCGGRWKQTANTFNPGRLTVIVEEAPVWIKATGFTGWVNGYTDGKEVHALIVGGNRVYTAPKNASLATFSSLAEWELGNALAMAAGYTNTSLDDEVGSRPPCSVASVH